MKILKNKFLQIFIISFTLTLILYSSTKTIKNPLSLSSQIRKLLSAEEIGEICSHAKQNLKSFYANSSYDYNSEYQNNKYVQYLINYLENEKTENLKDYIPRLSIIFAVLCLDILLIFFYFGYCICCCCPCCCCKNIGKRDCCSFVSFILSIGFYGIVVIACFVGVSKGKKVSESLNSTSCSIFEIYAHFIYGDDCIEKPVWSGIKGVKTIIKNTQNEIGTISNNTEPVINKYKEVESNPFDNDFAQHEYDNYISENNENPDPDKDEKVRFVFYENLKQDLEESILKDYELLIDPINLLKNISEIAEKIKDDTELSNNLNNSLSQLDDINDTFLDLENNVLNDWYEYQKNYNKHSDIGILILFGILLLFPLISFIGLLLFCVINCQCARFMVHFSWILDMILIFFLVFVGIFFSLIGIISKDGVGVMQYVTGKDNLNKTSDALVIKGNGAEYLNICFNGNGDLQNVLDLNTNNKDSATGDLSKLYDYKDQVDNVTEELYTIKSWNSENSLIQKYEEYKNNLGYYENNNYKTLNETLKKLRYYTDGTINSSVDFYHLWVLNKNDCENGYEINEPSNVHQDYRKYCFILKNDSQSLDFYDENLKNIFNNYTKFVSEYNNEIEVFMKNGINKYYQDLNDLKFKIIDGFLSSSEMIDPIYNIYNKYLGEENSDIFSILNCRFLKRDANIFFDILDKDLGKNSQFLGYLIIIACFGSALGFFFSLIVILRVKEKKRESPPRNDNESRENLNPNKDTPLELADVKIKI